jgi:hypothetical protein
MTKPNTRAVTAGILFLGILGAVACDTATKSAKAAEERHRLVGLACGPKLLTLTAVEEDEFTEECEEIDTPENICGHSDAKACADYMGDGY